jgi:hypothetical protein
VFELGPPSRKRQRPELAIESHHGEHQAHGEEEKKKRSWMDDVHMLMLLTRLEHAATP